MIPTVAWAYTAQWLVELEDQVVTNHQGDQPEGQLLVAHLMDHRVVVVVAMVMTIMMNR